MHFYRIRVHLYVLQLYIEHLFIVNSTIGSFYTNLNNFTFAYIIQGYQIPLILGKSHATISI